MPEPLLTVWDLDETVGHALRIPDGYGWRDEILIRPGLADALEASLNLGPNMVWTAAGDGHAERMIQAVRDVTGHEWPLRAVWTRARCTQRYDPDSGAYHHVKPLRKLRRAHPLSRVVAVDDRRANFTCAYGNLVAVPAYTGGEDAIMPALARYLPHLAAQPNVRSIEKRGWHTQEWT